ncbi:MAG: hypothetical protein GY842_24400 [bacterium]|nr:hypothetical protein [bacterium]
MPARHRWLRLSIPCSSAASGQAPASLEYHPKPAGPDRAATGEGTALAWAGNGQDAGVIRVEVRTVERRVETVRREQPRTCRSEPCPCGSGKKSKNHCGRR